MCWSCTCVLGISKYTRDVCHISPVPNGTMGLYKANWSRFYQEYRAKTLTEKYANLNTQMDKVIHNANTEILSLQNKLSGRSH